MATTGNLLLNDLNVQAMRTRVCIGMVKRNSPVTSSNGEHAIWLNGVKVSHLGQDFEWLLVGRRLHPGSGGVRSRVSNGGTRQAST